ncbi:MAG: N-acetylmuramoyl-L-alanine amidase CwlD [Bacilli bacterium]
MKQKRMFLTLLTIILTLATVDFVTRSSSIFQSWHMPLSGKTIMIDAGHGLPDGGAVGNSEIIESKITLEIAKRLRDYIEEQGGVVLFTRQSEDDLAPKEMKGYSKRKSYDLRERVYRINNESIDFFISIHLNAIPVPSVKGAQTFYYPSDERNKIMADAIQYELKRNLPNANRESKKLSSVYLLKRATKPGVLVEAGFLSNAQERFALADSNYQEKIAVSVYQGIIKYVTEQE